VSACNATGSPGLYRELVPGAADLPLGILEPARRPLLAVEAYGRLKRQPPICTPVAVAWLIIEEAH
jgi:hypothetical protein